MPSNAKFMRDRLALIARGYDDCEPTGEPARLAARDLLQQAGDLVTTRSRRVLVLGWNQKLPSLLEGAPGLRVILEQSAGADRTAPEARG